MVRDHVSREKALAWMALQLPEDEKARRADFLIHNATEERLVQDIDRLLDECRRRSAGGLKKN
jgi:dephospho-CoA kinase